jgi:glycosyltransferase involved in cell wall biosynthesis
MLRKHRWTKRAYARLFERPILKDAAAIQVFVEEQFVQLTDFGVDRPAFAVPNGFDPSQIPPAASEPASGAPSTGPKLLFLGRIDAYTKGLDLLLQALSHGGMTGCLPADLTLDIIGPDWGNQRGLARMSSKLGLANNVRFPGEVKGDDRWLALRTHELTVLPSRHDAFPFVFLESMIAARPLLISDASGSAAVVSRAGCGFVVSPTAESILNGMVRALSMRDEWNTLGQRGRAFAYAQLTWDRIAETAASNYERVLYDNRRSKGIARQGR